MSLSPMTVPPLPRKTPLAPRSRCRAVTTRLIAWASTLAITVRSISLSVWYLSET